VLDRSTLVTKGEKPENFMGGGGNDRREGKQNYGWVKMGYFNSNKLHPRVAGTTGRQRGGEGRAILNAGNVSYSRGTVVNYDSNNRPRDASKGPGGETSSQPDQTGKDKTFGTQSLRGVASG